MKKMLKKYVPAKIKKMAIDYLNSRIIINYFNKNYQKNVLLSYIVTPFKKNSLSHTNIFEAQSWAKVLDELGYNVDIIDFRNTHNINLSKYDLICGFGDIFQKYFEAALQKNITTIYYGAGMHVCHQNQISLNRIRDVHDKKGTWLGKSSRFVEKTWTHQTTLVDGIIALGNNVCKKSYQKYYDKKIYSLNAPFFKVLDGGEIIENKYPNANKSFLWFGSSGLIHKGLDLVLDFFQNRADLTLHICGPIEDEKDFTKAYKKELFESKNIITHGFVDLKSNKFKEVVTMVSFVISPSCSEGGSPSVVTTIGNGGLIPIISRETSLSTGHEIWINELTNTGVQNAVKEALSLNENEIKELQIKNLEYVLQHHAQEIYYDALKTSIDNILGNKNDL
jgi:hypothetical protein